MSVTWEWKDLPTYLLPCPVPRLNKLPTFTPSYTCPKLRRLRKDQTQTERVVV